MFLWIVCPLIQKVLGLISLSALCTCCHSFTVCHPPSLCHHVSTLLPAIFSFPSRPTFILVAGVNIHHKTLHENWDRFSTLHRSLWRIVAFECGSLTLHIKFALSVQWGVFKPHISPVSYPTCQSWVTKKEGGKEKRDPAFCFFCGGKHAAHYVKLLFTDHDHGIWNQRNMQLVTEEKKRAEVL